MSKSMTLPCKLLMMINNATNAPFTLFPQTKPPKVKDAPTGPPVWLDVSLEAGTVLTHVSQTTIHTIALSTTAWGQTGLSEAERVIFNHYIICNDTHEALRLGQVSARRSNSLFCFYFILRLFLFALLLSLTILTLLTIFSLNN